MLTINKYNKETLDRSSITIVDRYKGIVHNKVKDINDVRALTMMLYNTVYYYLYDAKKTLEQIAEIIDSWESETGIDTTPIRDEIKHTEAMVEAVEEITDENYGDSDGGDGGDNDDEIEEKAKAVENETEEVVEVIKQNPEVKDEVKGGVKEEAKTELPPSTPSTPSVPSTPEEAKENARQEAADSVRGRADDGRGDLTYEETQTPKDAVSVIIEVLTGEITATRTNTAEGAREEALNVAATVIENGGTAQEATQAYVDAINASAPEGYSPTDETAQTINDDIQSIIDAANEAANSGGETGETGGTSDEPSDPDPPCADDPDPPCDCDCSDSDCPDNPGCPNDTGGVMESC